MAERPTIASVANQLEQLIKHIGEETSDGKGTGLTGRIIRAEAGIRAYENDRNKIIGAFMGLAMLSALIILGVRQWIEGVIEAVKGQA